MAVDSGQPDGPTDEVSSSSSTSAEEAGHDKILTHAPVPGTTVDDAGTLFLAEQADDASKPVADPETPVPNPVKPIPEIAIVEQAGQLQVGHVRVEQPHEGAGQARHLEILAVILSPFASLRVNSAKGLARRTQRSFAALRMTAAALRMTGGTLLTVLSREVFSSNVWGQAPLLRGVARVEVKLDGVTGVEAKLDGVTDGAAPGGVAGLAPPLDEATGVEAMLDGVTDGAALGGVAGVGAMLDRLTDGAAPGEVTEVGAKLDGGVDGAAPGEGAEVGAMLDWGAGLVPPLREVTEVWAMLDEVVGQHYQAYRDGDKGAGVGAMLDEVARGEVRSRYSSRDVVVEERRHLPMYAPHKTL